MVVIVCGGGCSYVEVEAVHGGDGHLYMCGSAWWYYYMIVYVHGGCGL